LAAASAATIFGALACETTSPQPVKDQRTLSTRVPVITPLPESQQTQDRGGVKITVDPIPYGATVQHHWQERAVNPTFSELMNLPHGKTSLFVEATDTPRLTVSPAQLQFQITVYNEMSRVFRGDGTVVQFRVAGRSVAVEQKNYADLVQLIIPPRQSQPIKVYGPDLNTMPEAGTTVGFFLYDVVTGTDKAGNVTAKQNFEWYFNVAFQEKQQAVEVERKRYFKN
jgi:hypothetical protein